MAGRVDSAEWHECGSPNRSSRDRYVVGTCPCATTGSIISRITPADFLATAWGTNGWTRETRTALADRTRRRHPERMSQLLVDRVAIECDLAIARRRAEGDTPGSPAWDAAMEWVSDLERALAEQSPTDQRTQASA